MTYSDTNWCISCWKDFVTLNEEERTAFDMLKAGRSVEDIKKRLQSKENIKHNKKRKRCKILVKETGQIFYSLTDCAEALNADRQQIYSALKLKYKLKKKYTLEKIA